MAGGGCSAASPAMIRHVIGALADSSAEGLLEHLRIPTLVLHWAQEFIPVAEARNLAEHIPGAQLEILPGIDHQPWAGDVDAIVERVAAFLARLCDWPRPARPRAPRVTRPLTGWASLTDAEARVAMLAADGNSNPAIARELFLSRATIETHLKRVYAKLAIDGRHQLHLLCPLAASPGHSDAARSRDAVMRRAAGSAARLGANVSSDRPEPQPRRTRSSSARASEVGGRTEVPYRTRPDAR